MTALEYGLPVDALLAGMAAALKYDNAEDPQSVELQDKIKANGAKAAGAEVESFTTDDFAADKMDDYDAVAFGCPAMGDEVLEEDEFEPLFEDCKAKLSGKKIALFGSYGWGDG